MEGLPGRARETLVLPASDPEAIRRAADIILAGGTVAFPTETVYGLGADGLNAMAVRRVFAVKGRPPDNPLILHISDPEMLTSVARDIPEVAHGLIKEFWPGPLTLVLRKREGVPDEVTAGLGTVAVRCPDHPVALALIRAVGRPLAAPSANRSGRLSPTDAGDVIEELGGRVDAVLDGGPTVLGVESTVVDLTSSPPAVLRPGALPPEAIRRVLPDLFVTGDRGGQEPSREGAAHEGAAGAARSPGLKYGHYAPRASVILVRAGGGVGGEDGGGDDGIVRISARVIARAEGLLGRGLRVGVAATDETLPAYRGLSDKGAVVASMGERAALETIAAGLYRTLRSLDRQGLDVIVVEGVTGGGLGLAIMDRLARAAGEVVES